jgi:uridine phosphorylase
MGVLAVENESSALFVVANYRRVKAGTVLVAAGNLVSGSEAEDRKMLEKPLEMAIKIACESATLLEKDE